MLKNFQLKHTFFVAFLGMYVRFFWTKDLLTIVFALVATCAYFWVDWQEKHVTKVMQQEEIDKLKADIQDLKAAVGLRQTRRF